MLYARSGGFQWTPWCLSQCLWDASQVGSSSFYTLEIFEELVPTEWHSKDMYCKDRGRTNP